MAPRNEMLATLAEALTALGRTARAEGEWLRVDGFPNLRTPDCRGDRYVWGERSYKKPATLALVIHTFLTGRKAVV